MGTCSGGGRRVDPERIARRRWEFRRSSAAVDRPVPRQSVDDLPGSAIRGQHDVEEDAPVRPPRSEGVRHEFGDPTEWNSVFEEGLDRGLVGGVEHVPRRFHRCGSPRGRVRPPGSGRGRRFEVSVPETLVVEEQRHPRTRPGGTSRTGSASACPAERAGRSTSRPRTPRSCDRLWMDDGVQPICVASTSEQPVGLDEFEVLVHHRRRVDGDLPAHRPRPGWARASATVAVDDAIRRPRAERTPDAVRTIFETSSVVRPRSTDALAACSLSIGTISTPRAGAAVVEARGDQRLLVRQGDVAASFDRREHGGNARGTDHRGDHEVARPRATSSDRMRPTLGPASDGGILRPPVGGSARATSIDREPGALGIEVGGAGAGGEADDVESWTGRRRGIEVGDHVEGIDPDGPGASEGRSGDMGSGRRPGSLATTGFAGRSSIFGVFSAARRHLLGTGRRRASVFRPEPRRAALSDGRRGRRPRRRILVVAPRRHSRRSVPRSRPSASSASWSASVAGWPPGPDGGFDDRLRSAHRLRRSRTIRRHPTVRPGPRGRRRRPSAAASTDVDEATSRRSATAASSSAGHVAGPRRGRRARGRRPRPRRRAAAARSGTDGAAGRTTSGREDHVRRESTTGGPRSVPDSIFSADGVEQDLGTA